MAYYKFLHSLHMDSILIEGTLRVSSLSCFRRLESPQWIADRLEGSIGVKMTQGLVVTGNEISAFTPDGFSLPVKADTGGQIVMGNEVVLNFQHPETFVFCASQGDLGPLTKAMCSDREQRYDACIQD